MGCKKVGGDVEDVWGEGGRWGGVVRVCCPDKASSALVSQTCVF